ncbi:MAG TPA: hypothetical protein VMV36_09615 [Ignavibacteriaceae bacterium]|nr:hypothetical protein [Ignavibacteriaceae bacterium]
MLEKIRDKVAILIINYMLRKRQLAKQNFNDLFKKSESFFLILPEDEIDYHNSISVLKFFEIHGKKFTIFTNDFRISPLPAKLQNNSIDFGIKEMTFFRIPSKQLTNKLSGISIDVVIDLNRKKSLFHSCVANLVNAKVRIGFEKNYSDKFYNLQFANSEENPEVIYKNFLNCLQMF